VRRVLPEENDLSTEELFARVLQDLRHDDDTRLGALIALHGRPTKRVIDRSLLLCTSENSYERAVGLRVLRELKHREIDRKAMWEPIEPVVVRLVNEEADVEVLQWAISCLGYQPSGPDALLAVLARANHADSAIRFNVAAALPGLHDPESSDSVAVEALVKLTEDEDADVRSYALMGLVDDLGLTSAKREIVEARLTDDDEQIRRVAREALAGLHEE
jgi:HEAT repeat protein